MADIEGVRLPDNSTFNIKDPTALHGTDGINALADVSASSPSDSDLMIYKGSTSKWTAQANPFSNENLLINPFFTINQRGFTSGTGYCADGWSTYHTSATRNSDGTITITASSTNGNINTKIEYNSNLVGKTVTLSMLYSNGTVKSGTGIVPTAGSTSSKVYFDDGRSLSIGTPDTTAHTFDVRLIEDNASDSITIRAVKLELGTVSTLANDVEPNYTSEILKCQRYFKRIGGGDIGIGIATATTLFDVFIPTGAPMKTVTPTATYAGTISLQDTTGTITSILAVEKATNPNMKIRFNATGLTVGSVSRVAISNDGYIDISAE